MKKTHLNRNVDKNQQGLLFLKMKISIFLLFFSIFQIAASDGNAQKRINLDFSSAPLAKVMKEIKKQTQYKFFYVNSEINTDQKISVKVTNETMVNVLNQLFSNIDIQYTIHEKQIILTPKISTPLLPEIEDREIKGKVMDSRGVPLPEANVLIKGTDIGTRTDFDGKFTLSVPEETTTLTISYVGFETKEVNITNKDEISVMLVESSSQLDQIILVGSRGKPRTSFDSPVAVDNFNTAELTKTGKGVLDQQLMFKVPSYNSTQQPISDAAAHFSPADLRGLLPSRTLVLVNGKRKNASALVYSYVTPGRGEVGVDMKAVPSAALENVEILRDGASAQYGSDAVAGVINLVMKKKVDPFVSTSYSTTTEGDGEQYQIEAGAGAEIEGKGYANVTLSYFDQKRSQRAGTVTSVEDEAGYWGVPEPDAANPDAFDTGDLAAFLGRNPSAGFQVGLPDMTITNFAYNAGYTLDEETETEIYSFGTLTNRAGSAPQFARVPYWVSGFEAIYPDQEFFLAEMAPQIKDHTFALGLKTVYNNWNFDISSTLGKNRIDYYIVNSFNQSFGASSPSDFYNGSHEFSHVVNNLDIVRTFDFNDIRSITVAMGAEHRTENFKTGEGEFASYGDGSPANPGDRTGSESFGGFSPENVSDDYRNNLGVYTDISADINEKILIGGALRYETYSDFGSQISAKLNGRIKLLDDKIAIRASVSNGFRAPSLHQVYYTSRTTTLTEDGIQDNGILNNSDPALRALGIPELDAETNINYGVGATFRITPKIGLTIDYYNVDIADRIVLSGQVTSTGNSESPIDMLLSRINVGSAGFFLNAVNTTTTGLDFVLSADNIYLGAGKISGSLSANFNQTEVTSTNFPDFIVDNNLENDIFSREDVSRIETWRPQQKIIASGTYELGDFSTTLSFLNYGEVTYRHPTDEVNDATFGGKTLTDLSFSYTFFEKINFTIGANNLFDIYPDTFEDAYAATGGQPTDRNLDFVGRFQYPWQTTQFGIDGTRIFTRLQFNF